MPRASLSCATALVGIRVIDSIEDTAVRTHTSLPVLRLMLNLILSRSSVMLIALHLKMLSMLFARAIDGQFNNIYGN